MEVRKSRFVLWLAVLLLLGVLLLLDRMIGRPVGVAAIAFLAASIALVAGLFAYALRPFRFVIGADGLTLRRRGLDRQLPWSGIEKVILDPAVVAIPHGRGRSARLLLVPADGVDLGVPLSERSPLDERPCLLLLDFNDVRNTPDQVSPALAQFGGDRFVDLRQVADARFSVEFSIVLRGYDPGAVDALIAAGRRALLSDRWTQRVEAKARIEGASLPIVMRGYDRHQVDTVLHGLSAELAVWPGDEQPPKQRHDGPRVDG